MKIILALAGVALVGLLVIQPWKTSQANEDKQQLVMYKSPNCGCCIGHVAYLRSKGYAVEIIETEDMAAVKDEHNIPKNMESCHTTIADNYFIEGHIPIEAIEKLLSEKPEIEGIGLAGMPVGSPGMPGLKKGVFKILSLVNGEVKTWLEI